MEKKKKLYSVPIVSVTTVEVENSICSGSVNIKNEGNQGVAIENQQVNDGFGYTPDAGDSNLGGWDEIQK